MLTMNWGQPATHLTHGPVPTCLFAAQASLSYYPMVDAAHDRHGSCVPPNVNPLIQQVVMTAYIAMLGVPLTKVVWSWLFVPCYLFLDWRCVHGVHEGGFHGFLARH